MTSFAYDPFGNLEQTDNGGVVTAMTWDIRGRKRTMLDPDMGAWSYDYNALDELTGQTDARPDRRTCPATPKPAFPHSQDPLPTFRMSITGFNLSPKRIAPSDPVRGLTKYVGNVWRIRE